MWYFYSGGISNGGRSSPDSWNKSLAKCGKPSPKLGAEQSIDYVAGLLAPGLQESQFKPVIIICRVTLEDRQT